MLALAPKLFGISTKVLEKYAHDGLTSLLIVVAVLLLRSLAVRALARTRIDVAIQLRWRAQIRNATLLIIVLGVTVVWAQELRTVAISVVAVAAALVLATKELIMCLMGSMLRASGSSFHVGDRIEVTGIRGDVVDIGPLTTTVLEVGPGLSIHQRSGRRVTLPNSLFLIHGVINETTSNAFVLHVLRVPLDTEGDWREAEERLVTIAQTHCAQYVEDTRRALAQASLVGLGQQLTRCEPVVYLELPEPGRVELLLRFPAPARMRGRVAQQILREFLGASPTPGEPPGSETAAAE